MAVLSTIEQQKMMADLIANNKSVIECRKYGYEEIIHREGSQTQTIYVVKEGVFRIGITSIDASNTTISFCFSNCVVIPITALANEFPSLFQIKSIENNLSNHNSLYEISTEQWNNFMSQDVRFKLLTTSILHNNLATVMDTVVLFRRNRKIKESVNYRLIIFRHSSIPPFSFIYQQILSVANTIFLDLDTIFVRLVNLPIKCLMFELLCSMPVVYRFPIMCLSLGITSE